MGETFIVCIHNISDNHPYAILRTRWILYWNYLNNFEF